MKISYFAVNNFRCISGGLGKNKIEFNDSSTLFIFGQNNVGKSSFLQAYQFFYNNSSPTTVDFYNQDDSKEMVFELEVVLDEFDNANIEKRAPKNKETFKTYLKDGNTLRISTTYKKVDKTIKLTSRTFKYATSTWEEIGYGSIGLHQVFQSCMPKPIFIQAMPTEEQAKEILNEILKAIAESKLKAEELDELKAAQEKIKELQDKMYKAETIAKYEESINTYFEKVFPETTLSIKDIKSRVAWTENKLGKDFDLEFCKSACEGEDASNIPTTVTSYGHGTIRTAIFTLLLMRDVAEEFVRKDGRKDYMVLFEEPELFLYPGVIKQLRDLIYQVSKDELPYQVLCASHSPQMIDLSKPKSSIIRMIKTSTGTELFQINDDFLKTASSTRTPEELKQEMYEVLRFNPHICESFYANEVVLIEGPTEEIILRAYLQEVSEKDVFVLNCGSVTNIPFYQKVLSKFNIKYNVICDTDDAEKKSDDITGNPIFDSGIQGTISSLFQEDKTKPIPNKGIFRVHETTFEPAHQSIGIPDNLRFVEETKYGKPYNANLYWKKILKPNLTNADIIKVPIIKYIKEIVG
jgi:putative ATP-dependent endonuclease of the OLD family